MIEIRNLQFQPLTFNLSGQGTLHLGPRERKSIARKDLSAEIKTAGKREEADLPPPPRIRRRGAGKAHGDRGRRNR